MLIYKCDFCGCETNAIWNGAEGKWERPNHFKVFIQGFGPLLPLNPPQHACLFCLNEFDKLQKEKFTDLSAEDLAEIMVDFKRQRTKWRRGE